MRRRYPLTDDTPGGQCKATSGMVRTVAVGILVCSLLALAGEARHLTDSSKCYTQKLHVCKKVDKVRCNEDWCEFPYECQETKEFCEEEEVYERVCEEFDMCSPIQRKCGFDDYDLFCNPDEDCVRDKWHCEEGTVLQGYFYHRSFNRVHRERKLCTKKYRCRPKPGGLQIDDDDEGVVCGGVRCVAGYGCESRVMCFEEPKTTHNCSYVTTKTCVEKSYEPEYEECGDFTCSRHEGFKCHTVDKRVCPSPSPKKEKGDDDDR